MKRLIQITALLIVFAAGCCFSIYSNWRAYYSLDQFRSVTKEKQISILRIIGIRSTPLRVRDFLLAAYPDQPGDAHELAHIVGETAYLQLGSKGFRLCDSAFTFACFHGVILAAIKAHGNDESVLKELATGCHAAGRNQNAKNSCAHGIGHGIMWVRSYDLLTSYGICDRLFTDEKLRFMCWDGVSMENVVKRGETAAGLPVFPWKEDNIYFPCDSIPVQYQPACVREHLYLLRLVVFNKDTDKSISYCMHFPDPKTREECFSAFGGTLDQDDASALDRTITECHKAPEYYGTHCLSNAAGHRAWSREQAKAEYLCNGILQEKGKQSCLGAIKSAIDSLYIVQSM